MLRADNAEVVIHPSDRKYGALLVGGQGTREDARAALASTSTTSSDRRRGADRDRPQVRALAHLPAHHAARLRQARLVPRPRPPRVRDVAAAADRRPAAGDRGRADRRERRRRAAGHQREPDLPVLAPLPLPRRDRRDRDRPPRASAAPRLEDVYTLLRPAKDEFRAAVAEACADQPDLDQTAEFFRSELPDDLRMATSRVAERLDAPRNKISGLTGVPPLRRFFNHPTDIPLREIIEARDILIVDANMAAIGTENSKACMLFILRMLHAQLQRQVHLPERRAAAGAADRRRGALRRRRRERRRPDRHPPRRRPRARVRPAVLRAARLRLRAPAEDPQRRAQPPAEPVPVPDGRRPGRRAGHPDRDGRLLHDDPRRPRLPRPPPRHPRATPELPQLLLPRLLDRARHPRPRLHRRNLPAARHRRPSGPTTTSPNKPSASAPTPTSSNPPSTPNHPTRARQQRRTGTQRAARDPREYLTVPYEQKDTAKRLGARWDPGAQRWYIPAGIDPAPFARWRDPRARRARRRRTPNEAPADEVTRADQRRAGQHRTEVRRQQPPASPSERCGSTTSRRREPPNLADSPVRRIVGRRAPGPPPGEHDAPAPDSLRELAFLDRINEIGPADQLDGAASLPRLYDEDYTILALLDRAGLVPRTLIGRAALPGRAPAESHRPADQALPPRADRPAPHRHTRAHPQRRQAATAVLAHPTRPRGRADPRAARDLPQTRMAADRAGPRAAPRARPARARLGDRTAPPRRGRRDRPLAHPPLRHRPLPRPPGRLRPRPPPHHRQRDPRPRRPGDHRPRPQDLHRGQARPLPRASHRRAEAHLRPARRARPHRPPLLQPRQAPRLRRVPLRLEPRPPPLPRPGHQTRCRVRLPQRPRRARVRTRGRRRR